MNFIVLALYIISSTFIWVTVWVSTKAGVFFLVVFLFSLLTAMLAHGTWVGVINGSIDLLKKESCCAGCVFAWSQEGQSGLSRVQSEEFGCWALQCVKLKRKLSKSVNEKTLNLDLRILFDRMTKVFAACPIHTATLQSEIFSSSAAFCGSSDRRNYYSLNLIYFLSGNSSLSPNSSFVFPVATQINTRFTHSLLQWTCLACCRGDSVWKCRFPPE